MRMSTARDRSRRARPAWWWQHIGLVKALAHRLAQRLPPQVEMPDLISVGVLGLMDAAGRYRASLGVPFDAFARRRVQGAMLDALRELDWAPRSLRKHAPRARPGDGASAPSAPPRADGGRNRRRVEDDARPPTDARSNSSARWSSARSARSTTAAAEGAGLLDLCFDPDEGPEVRAAADGAARAPGARDRAAAARERHILAMYYQQEMTLAEIGAGHRGRRIAGVAASLAGDLAPAHHAACDPRSGGEGGVSADSRHCAGSRPPMHAAPRRCSSVEYSWYSPSSRLADLAPRRPAASAQW